MRAQNLPEPLMGTFTEKIDVLVGDGGGHEALSMVVFDPEINDTISERPACMPA
jgi:hypothetical protein